MPIDTLPNALILPGHDDVRNQYLRDVRIRTPSAVTVEGTKDYADASVFADQTAAIYYDAKVIADFVAATNKTGSALDQELINAGTYRFQAAGGTGAVLITASSGGGIIFAGDEIKDNKTGLRFQCIATGLYLSGAQVPVTGVDVGPSTNLPSLSAMQWTTPRPGISPNATVVQQADLSGLSGGRLLETDDQANLRLRTLRTNPPSGGNDAHYQALTTTTPLTSIQQCFTYNCPIGSGSIFVTYTLRPATPGGNRIPNALQNAQVRAWLRGQFPGDDQIFMGAMVSVPVVLAFKTTWAVGATGWADASPWPPYVANDMLSVFVTGLSATTFRIGNAGGSVVAPQVGQVLAFYDQTGATFRRKKILTVNVVVAGAVWDLTVDTTNSASDITYTPLIGQAVCPWSDSLVGFVAPLTSYFDNFGPGEQITPLPDPGLRMARNPPNPVSYPSSITNRITTPLFALPTVSDVVMVSPSVPYACPVGAPGAFVNLLTLGSIVVFPQ